MRQSPALISLSLVTSKQKASALPPAILILATTAALLIGPVVAILGYETVEDAVKIGNDTEYGLAAYVSGSDPAKVREVASRLRAGQVNLNSAGVDMMAPFGGYKMSGNGREWGDHAFGEFLETKAVLGYSPKQAAE